MGSRPPLLVRLKQVTEHRAFRYGLSVVYLVNLLSFVLLLACDCFHWWRPGPSARMLTAEALAVTSYLAWMLYTFLGVGYLTLRQSTAGRPVRRTSLALVRAVGYPLLYTVYAAWGFTSLTVPKAWLGGLSVGTLVAFRIVYHLAKGADGKPRPPSAPREALSQKAHSRTA